LLEYPQYTRPPEYRGMPVPDVLLSGHHEEIARWRRAQSIERTAARRPDMLARAKLTSEERRLLEEAARKGAVPAHLFRVIMPVPDFERGAAFYAALLGVPGERVSPNRHYFRCGGTILAIVDPSGHDVVFRPNVEHVYFAVPDLRAQYARARDAGCSWLESKASRRPWGEKSFYARDPFGNPICFVDETTVYTGGPMPEVTSD
jgi:catechol 2,3-dioxygenase-like lactoylglutathione lyase family enzyme